MPQRKITEPITQTDDLPQLTEQQQEFVRLRLAGKSATDAYKAAYDCVNSSPRTIWAEASRANTHPDIAAWLAAARHAHLGSAVLTRDQHMQELESIREGCKASGNWGAALGAEVARGKVAGHQIERIADVTATDPADMLRAIAKDQPDIAAALAQQAGIAVDDVLTDKRTLN